MKTLLTTLLTVAAVFAVGVVSAQVGEAPAAKPAAQAMCCMDSSAHMGQMDAHMKRMQALHEQRASATTPEDRQRLIDDQRREMQQGMAMMQAMPHGGSMMGGAGMGTMGQKGTPADQKTQMQMMEKRMDMMQTMMQVMMDQLDASGTDAMPASTR
jgi:hypothetical protein